MSDKRVAELQSDRIEMVLASHKAPARVAGGVIGRAQSSFTSLRRWAPRLARCRH